MINRTLLLMCLIGSAATAGAVKPSAPKMVVQLIGQTTVEDHGVEIVDAYFLLPDGSHAIGHCLSLLGPPCSVESFIPEKRTVEHCVDSKRVAQITCFTNSERELYYADRSGNALTVYGANGGILYHIVGSWGDFSKGTLHAPAFDPNWTAVCNDGTFSYSQSRSGTCSDHGGVHVWHP